MPGEPGVGACTVISRDRPSPPTPLPQAGEGSYRGGGLAAARLLQFGFRFLVSGCRLPRPSTLNPQPTSHDSRLNRSRIVIVVPFPGALSIAISPPWASMIDLAMARP